jgi:putative molybdenum carrier protein
LLKIISGGQTGVDRAALDVAIEMGIAYGGWCPKGGWAEDLPRAPGVLAIYKGLQETPHLSPRQRTKWNIRDADRLMVLVDGAGLAASKGTEAALDYADRLDRPHFVIDLDAANAVKRAVAWLGDRRGPLILSSAARAKARPRASMPRRRHFCVPFWSA